jgi:hypothetical protein
MGRDLFDDVTNVFDIFAVSSLSTVVWDEGIVNTPTPLKQWTFGSNNTTK